MVGKEVQELDGAPARGHEIAWSPFYAPLHPLVLLQ